MRIITATEWGEYRKNMPKAEYLLDFLIPAKSKTLCHAAPGCGKSAFSWGAANAISEGKAYLGLKTAQANVLFISVDMNEHALNQRWSDDFEPKFDFICAEKLDVTNRSKFKANPLYKMVREHVIKANIGLVILDAIGGFHLGRKARDDDTATGVDSALTEWLPEVAFLQIGHDRKISFDTDGNPIRPSDEDIMGSQLWRSNVQSQIHMWRIGDHISRLNHAKSQVGPEMEEDIRLYIDLHGRAEMWNEKRAIEVVKCLHDTIRKMKIEGLPVADQNQIVATHLNKSLRTIQRWRSLANSSATFSA